MPSGMAQAIPGNMTKNIKIALIALTLAIAGNVANASPKHDSKAVAAAKIELATAKAHLKAAKAADRKATKAHKIEAKIAKLRAQLAKEQQANVAADDDFQTDADTLPGGAL